LSRISSPSNAGDPESVQRLTRRIDHVCELMARLAGSATPTTEFFQTLTSKTVALINATAGAVWLKSPQGLLQQQQQMNLDHVGLDHVAGGRELHHELLRHVLAVKQVFNLDPDAKLTNSFGSPAGNATAWPLVVAPILDGQGGALGLLEFWLDTDGDPKLRNVYINVVNHMAGFAAHFLRNNTALRNTVQEQVFTQIEAFSRKVHGSLNPTEVAFLVVNEGRRLIGCDRLSAGVRYGRHTRIEAVSGADVVERSSVQVKMMSYLFDAVLDWNERLVYQGSRDESLPPAVLDALDNYLAQSNPKLLVLQPLRDERELVKKAEKESKPGPARSALLLESFESLELIDPVLDRLDIAATHSASALYNASEMKRIPLAFAWKPVLALQGAAGGKRRFYTMLAMGLIAVLLLVMIFVPYDLKLDAKGELEPEEWSYIYPPGPGKVHQFKVHPNQGIRPNTPIAVLYDVELATKVADKVAEINSSQTTVNLLRSQAADQNLPPAKRDDKAAERDREISKLQNLNKALSVLLEEHHADRDNPGQFTVLAPEFQRTRNATWTIVSSDFEHQLVGRQVKPSDPLLRVGDTAGAWQIEQKIPQKHISQLLRAFKTNDPNEYLNVDVLLTSAATQRFKGRLYRKDISAEAVQNKDDHNESELIVYAYVRVNEPDMPPEDQIPVKWLVTGAEVKTVIRCGDHSLGYSLFHGAWEFVYEHVLFSI
jgi:hypothetical protein